MAQPQGVFEGGKRNFPEGAGLELAPEKPAWEKSSTRMSAVGLREPQIS